MPTADQIVNTIESQHVKVSTFLSLASGAAVLWIGWAAAGYEKEVAELRDLIQSNAEQVQAISSAAARTTYLADSLEKAVEKAATTSDANSRVLIRIEEKLKQVERKVDAN